MDKDLEEALAEWQAMASRFGEHVEWCSVAENHLPRAMRALAEVMELHFGGSVPVGVYVRAQEALADFVAVVRAAKEAQHASD